jgi:hypothetical protein
VSRSRRWVLVGQQLDQQRLHAALDLVADGTHGFDSRARRVLKLPVELALAREIGQAPPRTMVITTSEAYTASVVRIFGVCCEMSMPTSTIAATAAGFT